MLRMLNRERPCMSDALIRRFRGMPLVAEMTTFVGLVKSGAQGLQQEALSALKSPHLLLFWMPVEIMMVYMLNQWQPLNLQSHMPRVPICVLM